MRLCALSAGDWKNGRVGSAGAGAVALRSHHRCCDYPQHDGLAIPEVPAAPKLRHSAPSRHSRSTRSTQTSSFRAQSRNPSLPANASAGESSTPCTLPMDTATSRSMTVLCGVTVCAEADDGVGRATVSASADTSPVIPEVPAAPKLRHSAPSRHSRSTRSTQTSSFRAQSRNP